MSFLGTIHVLPGYYLGTTSIELKIATDLITLRFCLLCLIVAPAKISSLAFKRAVRVFSAGQGVASECESFGFGGKITGCFWGGLLARAVFCDKSDWREHV